MPSLSSITSRVSAPLVISVIALCVAVTGTAMANLRVTSKTIVDRTIQSRDVKLATLTGKNIAFHTITNNHVQAKSLVLGSMQGADVTGSLSMSSLSAYSCDNVVVPVAGARVGDIPVVTFADASMINADVMFTAVNVPAADQVTLRACNVFNFSSGSNDIASGVRIRTFR